MRKIILYGVLLTILLVPTVAHQQVNVNYALGSTFGLGSADLQSSAIKTVQWILGLLGLIALIMIMASAFIAIRARDSERGAVARRALFGAIVGLIVILLAWAIVTFVIARTVQVTS